MTRVHSFIVACNLALGLAVGSALLMPVTAVAADAKSQKISAKVAKPLKEAKAAIDKQEWDAALAKLKEAQAVEKRTPFDDFQIDEFLGYVSIQQKNYGEAAKAYDRLLNSEFMPPEQVNDRMKAAAQLYSQVKDYPKTMEWAKKWLANNPNDPMMSLLLAQVSYLTNDFNAAADITSKMIAHAESTGEEPKDEWIEILLSAHAKQQNQQGIADALKKSVRYHPKAERWENLLDIYARKAQGDKVNLGYYRLMSDVGVMKRAGDYMEMAQLAIDAGVPGEAVQILQKGTTEGVLTSADKAEQGRYDRMVANAKKLADTDKASLPQLSKEAEKASNGQADVALGQAYLSYGEYDQAITALQRGIQKKQGVTDLDEAQISLGLAYLRKGDQEQARQAFKAIKPESKWADLADLWALRSYSAA
jgi:tetratricopeptide (TPR) repeat protein